jgi:hypothetical protein
MRTVLLILARVERRGVDRAKRYSSARHLLDDLFGGLAEGRGVVVLSCFNDASLASRRPSIASSTSDPVSLWEVASACGISGRRPRDPELDAADLCVHDLTLLGNLEPAPDGRWTSS